MEESLLVHGLHRARNVAMPLRELLTLTPRGPEQRFQCRRIEVRERRLPAFPLVTDSLPMVAEIIEVQPIRSISLQRHDPPHLRHKTRLTVGRQTHHLVLVSIMRKAEVLRHRLIENAKRMRKINPLVDFDAVARADAPGRTRKIAESVHRDRNSLIEWRNKKRRSQVRKMMLDLVHHPAEPLARKAALQLLVHARALALVANPVEHERQIRAPGEEVSYLLPEIRFRILIDRDMRDIGETNSHCAQAIADRFRRKIRPVLYAAEALFLRGRDQRSVLDRRRNRRGRR